MSKPPLNPKKTASGISMDPKSLERVVAESRRADGTLRKELKIRPGFTPQEDVTRFRGTKQSQQDANALPKGHIIGWAPPTAADKLTIPLSKNAKKRQKQKEKKKETEADTVKDNWEDEDAEDSVTETRPIVTAPQLTVPISEVADALTEKLEKLEVK